ncbi:aquaporin [Apiospora arundinis]
MPASISDNSTRTSNVERTLTERSTLHPTTSIDEHDNFLNIRTKTPRAQKYGPGSRTSSTNNTHEPDFGNRDRDSGSYFEGATLNQQPASPMPSQFLTPRGRTMSFYEMQEQAKQAKKDAKLQAKKDRRSSMMIQRASWRSGEMPYNYADMIGGDRNNYNPPTMGRPQNIHRHSAGTWTMTGGGGGGSGGRDTPDPFSMRLPLTMWMHSEAKNLFVAALGEWVGTTMFLFFAFAGTQVANAGSKTPAAATTTNATAGFDPVVMLYIAVSFGFSLMVNVWVFFRISGGLFNPAVTLALWAVRAVSAKRAVVLFLSQIVGSITASALVLALFPTRFNVRTTLSEGTSLPQGVFIEAFMTAELVFTILMLAKEKHKSTFIAPVGIGLALFVAELVGVYYTGGSLNPARSLGPCIVTGQFDPEHWVYWVGPGIGALIAIAFYQFIKMLEYEMANPGQDGDDENDPTKNPNHELREKQREATMRILSSLGIDQQPQQQQQQQQQMMQTQWSSNSAARSAEEGAHYHPSPIISMDDSDHERRHNPGVALSTVQSMSDHVASPTTAIHHDLPSGRSSPHKRSDRAS